VLDGQELREIAAQALIATGIGERPGDDIDAVMKSFRERGVMQDGQQVALLWGQGGAATRQGELECHHGAAPGPGTRIGPAGQDRFAGFVGRFAGSTNRPRGTGLPRAKPVD
jgi:hypothetical protein